MKALFGIRSPTWSNKGRTFSGWSDAGASFFANNYVFQKKVLGSLTMTVNHHDLSCVTIMLRMRHVWLTTID